MEIILYRHAEPSVSNEETISGTDFPQWVKRYNDSGIIIDKADVLKEKIVHTSDLKRSVETGTLIGEEIIQSPMFREAEFPLIEFPDVKLKAKYWMVFARCLWLLGSKTRCESFKEAKQRATGTADRIETLLKENSRFVLVGHGFIIRLIKRELLRRGWILTDSSGGYKFLSKMVFTKGGHDAN